MKSEKVTKKYSYFNLDTMENVEVERDATFQVPENFSEATQLVGNDEKRITDAIAGAIKRSALRTVKNEVASLGVRKTAALKFAAPFRLTPDFAITETGAIKSYSDQTRAIFSKFRETPMLIEAIKATSKSMADDDDDEGSDD